MPIQGAFWPNFQGPLPPITSSYQLPLFSRGWPSPQLALPAGARTTIGSGPAMAASPIWDPPALPRGYGTSWEAIADPRKFMNQSGLSPSNPTVKAALQAQQSALRAQIPTPQAALGGSSADMLALPRGSSTFQQMSANALRAQGQGMGAGPRTLISNPGVTMEAGRVYGNALVPSPGAAMESAIPSASRALVPYGAESAMGQVAESATASAPYSLADKFNFLKSFGPQNVTAPTLQSLLPNSSLAAKATGLWGSLPGGAATRGLIRGPLGGIANMGIQEVNKRALGDTEADPTNFGQAALRGFGGGVNAGATFGLIPALVGGAGAGLGNAIGFQANGGNAHLGNLPGFVGTMFGGGSKSSGGDRELAPGVKHSNVTQEGLQGAFELLNLQGPAREQVKQAFNQKVADRRATGADLESAVASTFGEFFRGDKPLALAMRDQLTAQQEAAGAGGEAGSGEYLRQMLAAQALLTQAAPHLFRQDANQANMDLYNSMMEQTMAGASPEQQAYGRARQTMAGRDAIERDQDMGMSLQAAPVLMAQQLYAAQQAKAQEQAMRLEIARIGAAGKGGDEDLLAGV